MRHGHQVFGSVLHPGQRPLQQTGGRDDRGVFVSHARLSTERPADVGGDDPNAVPIEAEDTADGRREAVGHLGGDVDRQIMAPAVIAGNDGDRVALHGYHRDALVLQGGPHHGGGPGQRVRSVGAPVAGDHVGADLFELQGGVGGHRLLGVCDCSQRLIVDVDQLGGIQGGGSGLGDHHHHAFSNEAHLVGGKGRPGARRVQDHETVEGLHAQVGRGVDGEHPGGSPGGLGIDPQNTGMGQGRTDKDSLCQAVDPEVADVGAATHQQVRVLDPTDVGSKKGSGHGGKLPRLSAHPGFQSRRHPHLDAACRYMQRGGEMGRPGCGPRLLAETTPIPISRPAARFR